jgi:hypothetical protein
VRDDLVHDGLVQPGRGGGHPLRGLRNSSTVGGEKQAAGPLEGGRRRCAGPASRGKPPGSCPPPRGSAPRVFGTGPAAAPTARPRQGAAPRRPWRRPGRRRPGSTTVEGKDHLGDVRDRPRDGAGVPDRGQALAVGTSRPRGGLLRNRSTDRSTISAAVCDQAGAVAAVCGSTRCHSCSVAAGSRNRHRISRRLFQNFPVTPSTSGLAASQMAVSAPSRADCARQRVRTTSTFSGPVAANLGDQRRRDRE